VTVQAGRYERYYSNDRRDDQRSPGQRDRDRILYTQAFRRLAGITQVVSPNERYILHNRLTHSLEVAQIGRRLAEKLLKEYGSSYLDRAVGGIDPEVVEAACLAHDLGHPPFGHVAERELDCLAAEVGLPDGFNGNAQSFRIVTKLETRHPSIPGLNLTRATLNAILKYPHLRGDSGERYAKWGAYSTEQAEFAWARAGLAGDIESRTAEAELMDWADDVAYAVHDLEDFYRAGLIPLERLIRDEAEVERFLNSTFEHGWAGDQYAASDLREAFTELFSRLFWFSIDEPYHGRRDQRARLRSLTARLIARYINGVRVESRNAFTSVIVRDPELDMEVIMLKALTWHYVIDNASLATHQYGQRQVIRYLFGTFLDATVSPRDMWLLPPAYQELAKEATDDHARVRLVIDLVASMTEPQAVEMYHRLTGTALGSALDAVVL
jgi:deoxyguanosinetriphosphate triphosphohydrolase, putative